MDQPLFEITGRLNTKDTNTFILTVKSDSKKAIKESIEKYRTIRNNVEFLELKYFLKHYSNQNPENFLILDIDPVIYDESNDTYYYDMYCFGDNKLNSKMDIIKQFFEKFYGSKR